MRILFIHQNFPGQFLLVAHALKQAGRHELMAVTHAENKRAPLIPTRTYAFAPERLKAQPFVDHYAQRVPRGLAVAKLLMALRREGFSPDLVIGHGGWGETLFVKDDWPDANIILRVFANFKRWALGTYHGVRRKHTAASNTTTIRASLTYSGTTENQFETHK